MSGYTPIDDNMVEMGDVVSQELADVIRRNIDHLSKVIVVGQVVPIMVNIPGVPTPDPNIWQECNGSEITNPNSPLRSTGGTSRFTPNMTDRYIKVDNIGASGFTGGSHTVSFSHSHGGQTGDVCTPEGADPDSTLFNVSSCHNHSISSDLDGPFDWEPPFFVVKFFMKIS